MILSCNAIKKTFGDNPVIRDASFNIENGEKPEF